MMEITAMIKVIFETKQVSERFTKREFVVEHADNPKYPQTLMFQMTGDRVVQLNGLAVGDTVKIEFNLRGREWRSPSGEVKYFNSLEAWRVDRVGERRIGERTRDKAGTPPSANDQGAEIDDIPFATSSMHRDVTAIARVLR